MCESQFIPKEYSRACAVINLDALVQNMEAMHRNLSEDTGMFAVIKTDAYGHGGVQTAKAIEPLPYVCGFAVATAEEAFLLRSHHIAKPILVLGYTFPYAYEEMLRQNVTATVFREDMILEMEKTAAAMGRTLQVHIKVDTGMGRIGITPDEAGLEFVRKLKECNHLCPEGIFTHFARSDEADKSSALEQYDCFAKFAEKVSEVLDGKKLLRHCANSAALLELPEVQMDAVRAGISMYGLFSSGEMRRDTVTLRPVLSLYSHIVHIKEIEKGQHISYGGTYTAEEKRLVATIPVGYGDGYPRGLSSKGYVLIRGMKALILGRVCMDQFMVDVTEIPGVSVMDTVTLLGEDEKQSISAEELGELSGRFHYELLCDFGKRIPRVFVREQKVVAARDYNME